MCPVSSVIDRLNGWYRLVPTTAAHAVTVVVVVVVVVVVCGSYVQRRRVSVGRLTVVVIFNRCDSM